MPALPPASVPTISLLSPAPAPAPAVALPPYNGTSSYQYMPSPTAPASYPPDAGQSVGSGGALLSLSPVTTVEVLLICISGAVILHFITRYLYLRAHRQLALEGLQQAAASGSPGTRSSQAPGTGPQPNVEMHTVKPTVLVVQPDEEVCCGVEEDQKGRPSDQQLSSSAQGSQRKANPER